MKLQNFVKNESPSILLGLGIGGFIGAVLYTAKVAPKAKEKAADLPPEASKMAYIRAVAPIYIPVAGLVLASTGAILASNRIMKNRYAALLVLYSFSEKVAEKWKDAAKEELSTKSFKNIKDKVVGAEEDIPAEVISEAENSGATMLYDSYSGRWMTTESVETVRKAINDINEQMYREDFAPLNDFYFALKMDPIEYGSEVGWHIDDGSVAIELTPIIRNDKPYIAISFNLKPRK